MDIRNLPTITEGGRYQRADATGGGGGGNYVHDLNAVGDKVYLAHWYGGAIVHDKQTLATTVNPTPLANIESMRPSGFRVHHVVPSTDNKFLFLQDEFVNTSNAEKIKV